MQTSVKHVEGEDVSKLDRSDVDSSILLEVYLSQARAAEGRGILGLPEPRGSSFLLAVEVPIALRRGLVAPADRPLLDAALLAFDADVRTLHLYAGFPEIAARVRADPRYSRCQALDAVHLATAVLFREETGATVQMATFDDRLRAAAVEFSLPLLPP